MKFFQKKQKVEVNPYQDILDSLQNWIDERAARREQMIKDLDVCIEGVKSINRSLEYINKGTQTLCDCN